MYTKNSSVGQRLAFLLQNNKLKQKEAAEKIGISKNAMCNYINDIRIPDYKSLIKISTYFNISIDWLLMGKQSHLNLSDDENTLITNYRNLDSVDKNKILGMIELKLHEQLTIPTTNNISYIRESTTNNKYIPVIGKVAAGIPIEAVTYTYDDLINTPITTDISYALTIKGDSMEPDIPNGTTVLIKEQPSLETSEIGIISIDNYVTCKRFYQHDDYIELRSINPKYSPIIIHKDDNKDIRIVGKVVSLLKPNQ